MTVVYKPRIGPVVPIEDISTYHVVTCPKCETNNLFSVNGDTKKIIFEGCFCFGSLIKESFGIIHDILREISEVNGDVKP